jgi:hypothetical protein
LGDAGHQAMIALVTDDGAPPRKRHKKEEAEKKEPVGEGAADD